MSEHAVAAQESHKATGCTDCVQPVFVWILKCSGEPCSPIVSCVNTMRINIHSFKITELLKDTLTEKHNLTLN